MAQIDRQSLIFRNGGHNIMCGEDISGHENWNRAPTKSRDPSPPTVGSQAGNPRVDIESRDIEAMTLASGPGWY
jgi:hypothetical protein